MGCQGQVYYGGRLVNRVGHELLSVFNREQFLITASWFLSA